MSTSDSESNEVSGFSQLARRVLAPLAAILVALALAFLWRDVLKLTQRVDELEHRIEELRRNK
ncbi:MAG: hypothetical protein BroJett014_29550 [Planctomycetota bacterium]|nr:MAG: hypothetical protein BroJett014_29550 [Planctomycetota bacterium]